MDYYKTVVPSQLINERGANLVVINPGSANVRIGFANQQVPFNIPHCIARHVKGSDNRLTGSVQDQVLNLQVIPSQQLEREKAYDTIASFLKIPFLDEEVESNSFPRKVSLSMVLIFPEREEDKDAECEPSNSKADDDGESSLEEFMFKEFICGEEALKISSVEPYCLSHPIRRGHFNVSQHYPLQQVLEDFHDIWNWILTEKLHLPSGERNLYSAILVLPETFDNREIKEMLSVVLRDLKFSLAVVHQEGLAATFGNGLSTACVVNIGAQDGVALPSTVLTLPYGGEEGEYDAVAIVHSFDEVRPVGSYKTRLSALNVPPMGLFYPALLVPEEYPQPPRPWFHDYEDMLEDTWHMEFSRRPDMSDGLYLGVNSGLNMWDNYSMLPSRPKKDDKLGLAEAITSSILSTGRLDLKRKLFCSIQLIGGVSLTAGLVGAVEERVLHAIPSNEAIDTVEIFLFKGMIGFSIIWTGAAIKNQPIVCVMERGCSMERDLVNAPKFDYSGDTDDLKYVSGLSTIFVATIQEVKDRVSQIELIFCSQLFPCLQSTSKLMQKKLADTRNAMEAEWKKKEHALLHQIEGLLAEKKHCQDEIQQLCSSLEESRTKLMGTEQLVKKHELEKGQLMGEVESLTRNEVIIGELKRQLEQKTSEIAEGKELQQSLLEQSELNDKKLSVEQAKRRELLEDYNRLRTSYKQLKSQYLYLIRKLDDNLENENHLDRKHEVKSSPRSYPKKRRLQGYYEENEEEITSIASQTDETKSGGGSHEDPGVHHDLPLVKILTNVSHITHSSTRPSILPKNTVCTAKSEPIAGEKKGSSSWRDTRAKEARGVDLHDDFLDTPLEVVRNINKLPCKEAQDIAVPPPKDRDLNNYDVETQDMNTKTMPHQQCISVLGPNKGGFKYVEPVRKRTERENLKGVECQQCKKFYDAVLLGDDGNPDHVNRRCEHHDGVSRHRYRYAPPMTPEGFWNIGFDSDM
ncbi:Actin-related protein [Musa troglodytarum]|uniref:Actin-related protein n=1 Tax=Musa troglodytarum TaxID=320322 RepID=A0A9E7E8G3_9LILI|nr:Actin-related protein [Musa troglodytarum]